MTAPQATPLLATSAYSALAPNTSQGSTNVLSMSIAASAYLQRLCKRRFDEYITTHKHTARRVVKGGHLLDQFTLLLKDDCRAVTAFYYDVPVGGAITDGVAISSGYQLVDSDPADGQQTTSARELALDIYGSYTLEIPSVDPRNSIWVTGRWGFGGQWVNSGATVSGLNLSAAATAATVSSATNIEVGQVWKIESEYLYVNTLASTTATVDRGYNGSTAVVHPDSTAIYYWQADPVAQDLTRRLMQWKFSQAQSPMAGSVTVGDFSFPVDTSGLPRDLYLMIEQSGLLIKPQWIVKA